MNYCVMFVRYSRTNITQSSGYADISATSGRYWAVGWVDGLTQPAVTVIMIT